VKESSATYIAYNLRPAKQTERRLLLDFLKCVNEPGVLISKCRYVGMGATTFYDFHLLHRFLGVSRMVSIERDHALYPRSKFNCPYDFIRVKRQTIAEFLANDKSRTPTIYWLDYDDGIGTEIAADITALGTRVTLGGFAFVTVFAQAPGALEKDGSEARLEYVRETFGALAGGLTATDMDNYNFPNAVYRILMAAFSNSFAARTDGVFQPLFQVRYKDSAQMVTVGGCLSSKSHADDFAARVRVELPFLCDAHPYAIRSLNLTDRERVLFDTAVTSAVADCEQEKSLKALGFGKRDLDAYRDLIRFLPRYHESII
jgi:hypothetical protein